MSSAVPYSHKNKRKFTTGQNLEFSQMIEQSNPFDRANPQSMVNMLSECMQQRFSSFSVQELMRLGEEEIERRLKPETTLRRLRINLWGEYCRMQDLNALRHTRDHNISLGIEKICYGVCYPKFVYDKVMTNDLALAYLFSPPVSYEIIVKESLDLGFKRLREILMFPIFKEVRHKDGTITSVPDTAVADIVLKTVALLDLRINGAVPKVIHQRVESKNMNYTVTEDMHAMDDRLMDLEDLDSRIDAIRKETVHTLNTPVYSRAEKNMIYTSVESSSTTDNE